MGAKCLIMSSQDKWQRLISCQNVSKVFCNVTDIKLVYVTKCTRSCAVTRKITHVQQQNIIRRHNLFVGKVSFYANHCAIPDITGY